MAENVGLVGVETRGKFGIYQAQNMRRNGGEKQEQMKMNDMMRTTDHK